MPTRQIPVTTLEEGMYCDSVYFVRRRQIATARTGRTYINLILSDKTGEVTARVFNNVETYTNAFFEGDFIYVQARVQIYEGKMQLLVDTLERVPPADVDPSDFLPSMRHDADVLIGHLRGILETIANEKIRALCLCALDDAEIGPLIKRAPAARTMHHPYIGGLLEHTLSVIMLLDAVCAHYRNVDRDIALAGGLFHDIGKVKELEYDRAIVYSDHGRLIPHLVIGVQIVDRLCASIGDFPEDAKRHIQHIILSHHGTREFGSPVLPSTVEATIVNHVDDMDAKVFAYLNLVEKAGADAEWTERHFMLGTHVKRTTDSKGPLYDYRMPGDAETAIEAAPDAAHDAAPAEARKAPKKHPEKEMPVKQFDLLEKK
jgi:3'-5' exoribonuclease